MKDYIERLDDDIESCENSIKLMQKDLNKFKGYIEELESSIGYEEFLINMYKEKLAEIEAK